MEVGRERWGSLGWVGLGLLSGAGKYHHHVWKIPLQEPFRFHWGARLNDAGLSYQKPHCLETCSPDCRPAPKEELMSWSGPFYREARYTGTWSRAKEKAER